MTTYTAEDFAKASFARHPSGDVAAQFYGGDSMPWVVDDATWASNEDMADHGWVPVREAADQPITLDALHDAWENAEQADECNEGDILILRSPDSPTALVQAWRTERPGAISLYVRILHRAPKPKRVTAERLGALLVEWSGLVQSGLRSGARTPPLAEWLAERGVRAPEKGEK